MFCFDPRDFGKAANGFDRTGPYRAHFLVEAVRDLRARLQDAGSDLLVRVGRPEEVLPELAAAVSAGAVFCHRDVAHEADAEVEVDALDDVEMPASLSSSLSTELLRKSLAFAWSIFRFRVTQKLCFCSMMFFEVMMCWTVAKWNLPRRGRKIRAYTND